MQLLALVFQAIFALVPLATGVSDGLLLEREADYPRINSHRKDVHPQAAFRGTARISSVLATAARKGERQPTTIRLKNIKDLQYHGEITIGGQSLLAVYDTGSFDVVTLSTMCATCQSGATLYDSRKSSSFISGGGGRVTQNFGSGSLRAQQDKDSLSIGGPKTALQVNDMAFWQVVEHNMPFWHSEEGGQFSVIAGLCHTQYLPAEFDVGPYRDTLPGRLQIDRFAFCFEDTPGAPGWLTIGVPQSMVTSLSSAVVPMVGGQYWLAKLADASLGDGPQPRFKKSYGAMVDSASSFILVPGEVMIALKKVLREIDHDCQTLERLPDLVFHLGGTRFALPATAYMVEETSFGAFVECRPLVKAVERPSFLGPVWSLGLPFLRHYFTIFDRTGPRPSLHISVADGTCASQASMAKLGLNGDFQTAQMFAHRGTSDVRTKRVARRMDLRYARLPVWASANGTQASFVK